MSFYPVYELEEKISHFFGSKYAVATDCCTHAVELCLRYLNVEKAYCPSHTYISIPFTLEKLKIKWNFESLHWQDYYYIADNIIDAAVYWRQGGYIENTFMCLSFQFKKHLGIGRGGAILLDDKNSWNQLKKMSYDGRQAGTPWHEQNISTIGYHYYMTPESAQIGLSKLPEAISIQPKIWSWRDYPDLTKMEVFR